MRDHGGDWAGILPGQRTELLDFSANISPLGMPAGALDAAVKAICEADRYPDPQCRALRKKLSHVHGIAEEKIVCGNGAADLIWRICRCLQPAKAFVPVPTFTEYEAALDAVGCGITRFPLQADEEFCLNAEAFARSIPEGTGLVFLCNPNNPTGRLLALDDGRRILNACRECGAVLVVDECFLDFTQRPDAHTLAGELECAPNLIILKAFTKTYAMAGLRLGYALCGDAHLAERLSCEGQPWPVSHPAQAAGAAALDDAGYPVRLRSLIEAERDRMHKALAALKLCVIPGEANFLLLRCADISLGEKLREKGIVLRGCADFPGLGEGWFRTAVRTPAENDRLLAAMREVLDRG